MLSHSRFFPDEGGRRLGGFLGSVSVFVPHKVNSQRAFLCFRSVRITKMIFLLNTSVVMSEMNSLMSSQSEVSVQIDYRLFK